MFDVWYEIAKDGAAAIPKNVSELSALEWVEIGEKYPELLPEEFRTYEVSSDVRLVRESPFVEIEKDDGRSFRFKAKDLQNGKDICIAIDVEELMVSLVRDHFHKDEDESAFGGVLVCTCGIAGCAGLWSQTCHVSSKMVHWSVVHYEDQLELFFERETYEKGALSMLRTLAENPGKYSMTYDSLYERDHAAFVEAVKDLQRKVANVQKANKVE